MQIPVYEQQQRAVTQAPQVRASDFARDERVASLAPAVHQLAQGLGAMSEGYHAQEMAFQQSEDRAAMTDAIHRTSALHAQVVQEIAAQHQKTFTSADHPVDYEDLPPRFAKRVEDLWQEQAKTITNKKASDYFGVQMAHLRDMTAIPKAAEIEVAGRIGMATWRMTGMVKNFIGAVDAMPDQYPLAIKTVRSGIPVSGMESDKAAKLLEHAEAALTDAALGRQVELTPAAFLDSKDTTDEALTEKFPAWGDASANLRQKTRHRAQVLVDRNNARATTALNDRIKDHTAAAQNGVPAAVRIPKEVFDEQFGPNSGEYDAYTTWQSVAVVSKQLATMPDQHIEKFIKTALDDLRPTAESPGAKERFQAFNALVKDASAELDSRAKEKADAIRKEAEGQLARATHGQVPGPMITEERFNEARIGGHYADYVQQHDTWTKTADMGRKSAADIRTTLDDARERAAGAPPEKAGTAFKQLDMMLQAAKIIADQRNDDFPKSIIANDGFVRTLYERAMVSGKPEDMDRYMTELKAQSANITGDFQNFQLLTKADKQRLESGINTPARGEDAGDNMVARIDQLSKQYGKHWPDVVAELQASENPKIKLAEGFRSIMWRASSPADQAAIAEVSKVSEHDLKKTITDGTRIKDIENAVGVTMAPLRSALDTGTEVNNALLTDLRNTMVKMALREAGQDASASGHDIGVRVARRFMEEYAYFDNRGDISKYMVPANQQPDQVVRGAERVLTAIPKFENIAIPPDRYGLAKPEESEAEFLAKIKSAAVWRINNRGDGLALFVRGADNHLRRVFGKAVGDEPPKQLSYTWEQLRDTYQQSPSYDPKMTTKGEGTFWNPVRGPTLEQRAKERAR